MRVGPVDEPKYLLTTMIDRWLPRPPEADGTAEHHELSDEDRYVCDEARKNQMQALYDLDVLKVLRVWGVEAAERSHPEAHVAEPLRRMAEAYEWREEEALCCLVEWLGGAACGSISAHATMEGMEAMSQRIAGKKLDGCSRDLTDQLLFCLTEVCALVAGPIPAEPLG